MSLLRSWFVKLLTAKTGLTLAEKMSTCGIAYAEALRIDTVAA
jgi:hypothetical protein